MNQFRIVPLREEVVQQIRARLKDGHGHRLSAVQLTSRALCRSCLQDGNPETQKHILFSYMPFEQDLNPYAEVGPVYIHDRCTPYRDVWEIPPDLKKRRYLTVRGYSSGHLLIAGEMSEGNEVEDAIGRLFENNEVAVVHISDASTGCFFVKVVRVA